MNIVITNTLRISGLPEELKIALDSRLKFANPKWLENERMGRWNRKTPKELKFYTQLRNGDWMIPRGYIRHLIRLCKDSGIVYEIEDRRRTLPPAEFTFTGQLKPFQETAASEMQAKEFGILSAATGAGKTVIALHLIAARKQPALIVVHTKDLALQWSDRISHFLNLPKEEIGFIGGGKQRIGKNITVAMVQSLYKCVAEVTPHIGFLVVDECHRCPSRTFTEAVAAFDSRYMLGLSATPWRRDGLSKLIFWHLGDVRHEVSKVHLIQNGHILQAEVITRETDFKPYHDPVNQYSKMLSELTADTQRNQLIASDIARVSENADGVILVLSDRKAHCETLQALLKYKFHLSADILTGDLAIQERQDVIGRLNTGKVKVLIATGQLIGEGFDCRELSTLFLVTPIRFSGRVLQYVGRVLRPSGEKKQARVFDYVDVHVNVLKAAASARQTIYEKWLFF